MDLYIKIVVFMFGAIIGSFLNVVIYRLHTGHSMNGRSHCMSCGKVLAWYELFPVLSYIALRGSCRGCASYIPSRYLVVEVLSGSLFVLVWNLFSTQPFLLAFNFVLVSVCMVMLVYDIRHMIIPDELTIAVGAIACIFIGYAIFQGSEYTVIATHGMAGACATLFFWGLWYISKGRWIGFGDVKLAFPFGSMVGLEGVFSVVVLSFWIGAVISLTLLGLERLSKRGKVRLHFLSSPITIKSEVPFAPFFITGFLLVHLIHADIFTITYALFFQ